jgi:hypothetical protein
MHKKKKSPFLQYEDDSKILESVANGYELTSPEHQIIKKAAWALFFVTINYQSAFKDFLLKTDRGPTPQQKRALKKLKLL